MNIEIEAAGDLLAAGLVARQVEGQGDNVHGEAHHNCANCQAPVHGKFCSNCGQSGHIHRSVLHLGEELLHGLLHFDAKGWRTLPLLVFRPGQLTRRYIDGQRTRFVSPLALFLFMVFVMFFTFSSTSNYNLNDGIKASIDKTKVADLEASERAASAALVQAKAAVEAARKAGGDMEAATDALEKAGEKYADAVDAVAEANAAAASASAQATSAPAQSAASSPAEAEASSSAQAAASTPAQVAASAAASGAASDPAKHAFKRALKDTLKAGEGTKRQGHTTSINVSTGIGWIDRAAAHAQENPELALYKLKNAASKYSFLLVPLTMPFLWLMFFWKRGITMYDHAVFSLYSLCFMALLMSCVALVGYAGWGGLAGSLAVFAPPVHMFVQMRGTYGLSKKGAFWRTCAMLLIASITLALYGTAIVALSVS